MAKNVTNELLLENLKSIQSQLSDVKKSITDLATDIRGVKGHQAAFMSSELAQDGMLAEIRSRLDRVEKRLELKEAE